MEASPQNTKVSHVTKCKGDPNMWKAGMCSVPVANDIFLWTSSCCSYADEGNSVIVFAIRKYSSLFPSADKRNSLSYEVVTVAIEMVYLCVFLSVSFLGMYLWLFSSNRCSSQTSVRIRQLWKYLWAEKCKAGSNTKQWPGPHPSEVSRLLHDERSGNLEGSTGGMLFFLP